MPIPPMLTKAAQAEEKAGDKRDDVLRSAFYDGRERKVWDPRNRAGVKATARMSRRRASVVLLRFRFDRAPCSRLGAVVVPRGPPVHDYLAFMRTQGLGMASEHRGASSKTIPLEEDEQALELLASSNFDVKLAKLTVAASLGAGRGASDTTRTHTPRALDIRVLTVCVTVYRRATEAALMDQLAKVGAPAADGGDANANADAELAAKLAGANKRTRGDAMAGSSASGDLEASQSLHSHLALAGAGARSTRSRSSRSSRGSGARMGEAEKCVSPPAPSAVGCVGADLVTHAMPWCVHRGMCGYGVPGNGAGVSGWPKPKQPSPAARTLPWKCWPRYATQAWHCRFLTCSLRVAEVLRWPRMCTRCLTTSARGSTTRCTGGRRCATR